MYRYFILRFSWTTCTCDIYIHVIFTYNADWSAVLFNKPTYWRDGKFSSLFCNTIYGQILHILMKNSENRIWVMYNIKVHYVQVTEPCSVYLLIKIEIRRSFMHSNRLYLWLTHYQYLWHICTLTFIQDWYSAQGWQTYIAGTLSEARDGEFCSVWGTWKGKPLYHI